MRVRREQHQGRALFQPCSSRPALRLSRDFGQGRAGLLGKSVEGWRRGVRDSSGGFVEGKDRHVERRAGRGPRATRRLLGRLSAQLSCRSSFSRSEGTLQSASRSRQRFAVEGWSVTSSLLDCRTEGASGPGVLLWLGSEPDRRITAQTPTSVRIESPLSSQKVQVRVERRARLAPTPGARPSHPHLPRISLSSLVPKSI